MDKDLTRLPYRPCVGIAVFNNSGKVWIGSRLGEGVSEYSGANKRWQMPQGGIDKDEDPQLAALRELYEETGISSVEYLTRTDDWLTYDLPTDLLGIGLKGKFRGQKQLWFAYRFTGDENEIRINPPPEGHSAEFDAWKWEDISALPDLVIEFKKELYQKIVSQFGYLAQIPSS